jgi:hypothetical protein
VFELGKEHLDGVEIWGVLGQEEELGAHSPDGGADRLASMRSEIVHDDDVVWSQGWGEDLFDIEQEALAIDWPFDQPGRHYPIVSQGGDEGQGFPAAVRNLGRQALAARGPAAQGCHVGLGPSLVDEDQARGIDPVLIGPPLGPTSRRSRSWRSASFFVTELLGVDEGAPWAWGIGSRYPEVAK